MPGSGVRSVVSGDGNRGVDGEPGSAALKRAAQLFVVEEWSSGSPFVEKAWYSTSEPEEYFVSVAVTNWEICFTTIAGRTEVTVRGPETKASAAPVPQDAEFLGIQFRLGAFMPALPIGQLVDRGRVLPAGSGASFYLDGTDWEIPTRDNVDVFVERLARQGLLVEDPVVSALLEDGLSRLSVRSVERHILRATGLTRGLIRQIRRCETAVGLLDHGMTIVNTVRVCGYADHAHLTRSLRRFVGQTPTQITGRP